jgi:REP element-mobilizing transposase RayT
MPAHLLTWTTHGTWLPGDERGFVSRIPLPDGSHQLPNEFNTPRPSGSRSLEASARQRMSGDTVVLTAAQATLAAEVFADSAQRHSIRLIVGAVMPTHVHLVTNCTIPGSDQLRYFKGASSKRLSDSFGRPSGRWWTKSGSTKIKFDKVEQRRAVEYVLQHEPLAWCGERGPDRAQDRECGA